VKGIEKFLHPQPRKDYNGQVIEMDEEAMTQKEQIVYTGFLAQEVESLTKKMSYDFSGIDAAKNDKDLYGLRYAEFVVPLVKAVQELSNTVTELQNEVNELRQKIGNPGGSTKGFLRQIAPNPSSGDTVIEYFVPESSASAQLVLSDITGRLLRHETLNNRGMSQLTLSVSAYPSGTYVYSLFVDGKKVDSKQVVLTK
jgi:trimeric autotransporter adhesin